MSGKIAKLMIRGYENSAEFTQQNKPVAEFEAMFNSESFNVNNCFKFDDSQADSETGAEQKFKLVKPREFSFEFLTDATGAAGETRDVDEQFAQFKKVTGFSGKVHRPHFLSMTWGTFSIRCVLKKVEYKRTLFSNEAKPVRGVIMATFSEYKTPKQQEAENPGWKSRLLKLVTNIGVESLAMIAYQNYGDVDKYLDIAQRNGLNSLKEIPQVDRLELPAVDALGDNNPVVQNLAENTLSTGITNLF